MSTIVNKTIDKIFDYAVANEADVIYLQQELDNQKKPTNQWLVSYRWSGKLTSVFVLPASVAQLTIEQLKKTAHISNRQREGNFSLHNYAHPIQVKITAIKTEHGEKMIISLQTKPALAYHIDHLGMSAEQLSLLNQAVARKKGLIILTGQPVSGKTATAYSILQALNSPQISISTIEQPLKTKINSLNQIALAPYLDINSILQALKKQDTDIIYLNHLPVNIDLKLLADLANDRIIILKQTASDIISALQSLFKIPASKQLIPYLSLIINQALAKNLCQNCANPHKLDHYILEDLHDQFDLDDTKLLRRADFYRGQGCEYCQYSGYQGEISLFEFLPIKQGLISALQHKGLSLTSKRLIASQLHTSLIDDAFGKALQGCIPITEIQRLF